LTIFFIHLILTTYYSGSFPTSLFFWAVMTICATIIILLAEHLCVRRELSQDFKPILATEDPDDQGSEPADDTHDIELTPTVN
jgi:protein SYS1